MSPVLRRLVAGSAGDEISTVAMIMSPCRRSASRDDRLAVFHQDILRRAAANRRGRGDATAAAGPVS